MAVNVAINKGNDMILRKSIIILQNKEWGVKFTTSGFMSNPTIDIDGADCEGDIEICILESDILKLAELIKQRNGL